jgi:hypothetical protein
VSKAPEQTKNAEKEVEKEEAEEIDVTNSRPIKCILSFFSFFLFIPEQRRHIAPCVG